MSLERHPMVDALALERSDRPYPPSVLDESFVPSRPQTSRTRSPQHAEAPGPRRPFEGHAVAWTVR